MSRSLQPQYDGLAHGLATVRGRQSAAAAAGARSGDAGSPLSRSFAGGFQLTSGSGRRSQMLESVDRLFGQSDVIDTQSSVIVADASPKQSPRSVASDDVMRKRQNSPLRKPFERYMYMCTVH